MNVKLCLITEIPTHYRKLIYQKLDKEMECEFIVGDTGGKIKRLDKSELRHMFEVKVKYLGHSNWFRVKGAMKYLSKYEVIIDDLGIFCLSSWWLLIKSKFTGQKVYHWDHGWYGREGFIKKWLKRLYFGLATGAFIYGDRAIKLMEINGFNGNKLYPIHNSLNYDVQLELRQQITESNIYSDYFGNNDPIIIFIGRLTKVKRLDILIDALAMLKEKGERYNLIFVGSGDLLSSLEQQVEKLLIQKQVWFYGACYNEKENAELIYNADLCVAPGNIGLTAMHAMTFGCPCISHNDFPWQMPEFEAIHEGITGDFFERDNTNALAECISKWFAEKRNKREEVRKACFKEIEDNWNPSKQLEIIKSVIYGKN